ncbi:Uncharacterised protein [BD1-7 clade bacterium]|uniref:Methyltransferase type 12 domain-containing protein n=1 Tax=BD1-7 clade bacterium TaxID=2029982 RepID=A0A5S9QKK7_9GAMM|nr:Uncharacterised protein [BD1-7 clade bacterium]
MVQLEKHWNAIFADKTDEQLGWYERDLQQTLKYVDALNLPVNASVFLPGAGTSGLADRLRERDWKMVLNDISDQALKQLQQRVDNSECEYLHHDMSQPLAHSYDVDLWIDRAVLHFLLSDEQIKGYFNNLRQCVNPGGYVLLAEFAVGGAKKCAGLDICQYTIEEMQERLGEEFELVAEERYTFINPFDDKRPYVYGLFNRQS